MESVTISFVILDDLSPCFDPVHVQAKDVRTAVCEISKPFLKGEKQDPSGYYFEGYHTFGGGYVGYNEDEIVSALEKDGFYRMNRFEKYYVIAWALNYTRFEVFSKECDKELIDWGKSGEIKGIINNDNYNENPVVTFLNGLGIS